MMKLDDIIRLSLTLSPQSIPQFWTFMNAILLLYSTALLIILAFRDEGDRVYDVLAHEWYLTYDVVVCLVWLVETSLTMAQTWFIGAVPSSSLDNNTTTITTGTSAVSPITTTLSSSSSWWKCHVVEWILALYFVMDSMVRVMKNVHGKGHTTGMAFDVSINLMAYGYVLIAQYLERRQYEQQQQQQRRLLAGYEDANDVGIQSRKVDHNEIL